MESWILLAIIAGLASNAFNFLCRYFLKDQQDATAWAWFFEGGRLTVFLLLALFDWHVRSDIKTFMLLFFIGVSEAFSVYLIMKMHQYAHLSISTIISRTRLIWIPLIAFFFFHEHLQSSEYVGIVILFIGLSVAISPKKLFVDKGAVYANVAAIAVAINTVLLKVLEPTASIPVIMLASGLPSVLLFPFVMKHPLARIKEFSRKKLVLKISAILIQVISSYFFLFALRMGEVSKVNAIYQGMMLVSILAGIIFLNERKDIAKKLIGASITLIGVFLLTGI